MKCSSWLMLDQLFWQYKGNIPWGKEPAELPGAAMWEMGGELIWRWRITLFHHLGHAHHAAWTLEDFTVVFPAKAVSYCTHPQGLRSFHQQVREQKFFFSFCFFKDMAVSKIDVYLFIVAKLSAAQLKCSLYSEHLCGSSPQTHR